VGWIYLVGFMGVGKTTLGRSLASELDRPFFDLDEAIVADERRSVATIFELDGEAAFRRLETRALRSVTTGERDGVVATGGGTYTIEENRRIMSASGVTVWLDVPFATLERRVDPSLRPLWDDDAASRELARKRRKYYGLADLRLELGSDSVETSTRRLRQLVASYRNA